MGVDLICLPISFQYQLERLVCLEPGLRREGCNELLCCAAHKRKESNRSGLELYVCMYDETEKSRTVPAKQSTINGFVLRVDTTESLSTTPALANPVIVRSPGAQCEYGIIFDLNRIDNGL